MKYWSECAFEGKPSLGLGRDSSAPKASSFGLIISFRSLILINMDSSLGGAFATRPPLGPRSSHTLHTDPCGHG